MSMQKGGAAFVIVGDQSGDGVVAAKRYLGMRGWFVAEIWRRVATDGGVLLQTQSHCLRVEAGWLLRVTRYLGWGGWPSLSKWVEGSDDGVMQLGATKQLCSLCSVDFWCYLQ